MAEQFGLSYFDAVVKSMEISKRDAEAIPEKKDEILSQAKVKALIVHYGKIDPDRVYNFVISIENRRHVLENDLTYLARKTLMAHYQPNFERVEILQDVRFLGLVKKYQCAFAVVGPAINFKTSSILQAFFYIVYDLITKNAHISLPLHESMQKYTNFKRKHQYEAILTSLPAGKKYGGLVKALLHLTTSRAVNFFQPSPPDALKLDYSLGYFRVLYNSKIITQEKRIEWFKKLQISEDDCASWSKIFDSEYPQYSYIHKLFDQVA